MEDCIVNRWSLMVERKKQDRWSLTDLIGSKTDELIQKIKELEGLDSSEVSEGKVFDFILKNVCTRHFTTVEALRGKGRQSELTNARFEYVYLCDTYPTKGKNNIGRKKEIMRRINRSRSTFYNSFYTFKNYLFAKDEVTRGFRAFQLDLYKRISRRDFDM